MAGLDTSPAPPPSHPTPEGSLSTSRVALVGNPNTGKTSLFNALTGLRAKTANFPGSTVDIRRGRLDLESGSAELIDLPGLYSLDALSPEEALAASVLRGEAGTDSAPDAVLVVIDATHIERNLYLASEVVDLQLPTIVALNMMDVARSGEIDIDAGALSQRLGVPVVPMCANRREGIAELRGAILDAFEGEHQQSPAVPIFPETLERQVEILRGRASSMGADGDRRLSRVEAFRALVDEGGYTEERLVAEKGEELSGELARRRGEIGVSAPLSSIETEVRYSWINRILDGCLSQATEPRRTAVSLIRTAADAAVHGIGYREGPCDDNREMDHLGADTDACGRHARRTRRLGAAEGRRRTRHAARRTSRGPAHGPRPPRRARL